MYSLFIQYCNLKRLSVGACLANGKKFPGKPCTFMSFEFQKRVVGFLQVRFLLSTTRQLNSINSMRFRKDYGTDLTFQFPVGNARVSFPRDLGFFFFYIPPDGTR